jgi:hypothetical protein
MPPFLKTHYILIKQEDSKDCASSDTLALPNIQSLIEFYKWEYSLRRVMIINAVWQKITMANHLQARCILMLSKNVSWHP